MFCFSCGTLSGLRQNLLYHLAMINLKAFTLRDFQFSAIKAHKVQNGGVDISDIVPIRNGVKAEFIRFSMSYAPFDAAARHPNTEGKGVVIPAGGTLGSGCPAKFGSPHDQGCFQKTSPFEI